MESMSNRNWNLLSSFPSWKAVPPTCAFSLASTKKVRYPLLSFPNSSPQTPATPTIPSVTMATTTATISPEMHQWLKRAFENPPVCLAYVKQHAEEGNAKSVIDTIEAFCVENPMIVISKAKGDVIEDHIRSMKPRVMVELGTFVGYAAVRFAKLLRDVSGPDVHFYTFEVSPAYAEIAREIIAFAGLTNQVTVITGAFSDQFEAIKDKKVDIYFIDHENKCFLNDAKIIVEQSNTLQKGSLLIADNMLFPGAPDYLAYIEESPQFTLSRFTETFDLPDGSKLSDMLITAEYQG